MTKLLRAVVSAHNSASIRFNSKSRCFVRINPTTPRVIIHKCRGLTRAIRRAFPVPVVPACKLCRARRLKRKTPLRPCSKGSDVAHGKLVDRQIENCLKSGFKQITRAKNVDPCVRRLLRYIYNIKKWIPVAAQVPMFSSRLGLATAADLLCTDARTKKELHLIEIKASRHVYDDEHCYRRRRGSAAIETLRGMPLSYYMQHQIQLWAMHATMRDDLGVEPTSSCVLRVTGHGVQMFPLDSWILSHETAVGQRLAIGNVKRKSLK